MANPGSSLRFNTHWSAPRVSALARSGGPRKMSQSLVSRNSNIARRMDRPKAVVGVIRGVTERKPSMSPVFCRQALASTESATSGQSATSQCLSALPGQLGGGKYVLDGLGWKKIYTLSVFNQNSTLKPAYLLYYSYVTTAWWLSTLRCNEHSSN